jgi:hypothetical protein
MTETSVATDVHQPFNAHGDFAPQITLYDELSNLFPYTVYLVIAEHLYLNCRVDAGRRTDMLGPCAADAIDCRERNGYVLVLWNINAGNSCHLVFSRLISGPRR